MKHKSLLIVSLLFSTWLIAQETPTTFTLQEAIDYALIHNRSVKNAVRDIEAAEKQKWETTATGLPQINGAVDYQNWIKQQVSLLPAEIAGGPPGTFQPVTFSPKQSLTATATLNQLLFDGSYIVGLQSAKVYLEISENAKIKTDLEVRNAVINAYGNVLLAEENLNIVNKNIEVLQKNLYETTKIYENGLAEEESVEQLQITLTGLENYLNNVKRSKNIAYQLFNITLGIDLNAPISLIDSLEILTLQNISLELLEADENIENSIDFQIAKNQEVSKELLLKLEKSTFLPRLSAFINGGYSGYSETFTFANNNQEYYGSSLFGVNMSIPIFSSGMRSAATQRAQIDLEIAQEELTETEQQLKFQISAAKSDYQFAIEEYQNKQQNLNLAERIEQKNQTKFFEGIASSFDLRQAQTQLYTAQQEYLQSMFNVITKKSELETVLNTLNY
ncbi:MULTISPECIES: TolC family protein [Bizionia]|uniref:TolC family protein n=1 Tax=Bizionia algoritergicola TaxID=291187 RepID=A0A5D0R391_9FLAO|nr:MULTISPECIES: TolC family protein [Bizionia]OBX23703.1 transporter [Bizionia sp. APA-3]TYB75425.1 TolC family protein [Bizionia algoritergicola]